MNDYRTGDEARPNSDLIQFLAQQQPKPSNHAHSNEARSWKTPAKPDPWLHRKFAVGIALALIIWSFYVVVGRVCAPAIQGRSSQGYGKAVGAGVLVGYVLLWLMFVWSYLKMILTGPGFAKHVVEKCPPPPSNNPSTTYIPYRAPPEPEPSEFEPVHNMIQNFIRSTTDNAATPEIDDGSKRTKTGKHWTAIERPIPRIGTGARWCRFCEINKNDRVHHCRHCGTCVMQFDHHCMWIGQCVGWANHKFFVIFNFWGTLFCLYIFIFLIVTTTHNADTDGQIIALIVCTGFFSLFTSIMFSTHIHLILNGKTTVESYHGREQAEQEMATLNQEFGYIWRDHEKRRVMKRWKQEYGGVEVDDRWRFGTRKDRWEQDMGTSWIGWFLPIGRPLGDGLHFATNPAFGPNGEWLKKKDWPFVAL